MVVDVCSGRMLGITVAVAHGFFSGSLNILLKFLISTYNFNYLTLIQCLTSGTAAIVLETLRRLGKVDIPPFSLQLAKTFGGVTILSTLQSTLTLWSLRGLSLPMYVVFKRCLPLVTLSIGVCVLKNGVPSYGVAAAVVITTTGAALAGAGDLTGDPFGYVTGVLAVIIHASYLVLIQKTSIDSEHGPLTAQYAIAIMASPVLLACSFVSMDAVNMWTYQGWKDPHISCIFTFCVIIGCAMNFTTLHCTYINSAVTTSFVGVVKSVATITVGMLAFEDVVPTRLFIAGVAVNTVGSVTYCIVKYFETKRKLSYQDLEEDGAKDGPLAGLPYSNEKPPLDGAGVQVGVEGGGVAVPDGMVGSQSQSPVADFGDEALLIGKGEAEPEARFLANNGDAWPSEDGGGGDKRSLGVMSERDVVEMQREHLQSSGTTGGAAPQGQSLGDSYAGVFRSVRHLQFMKKDALLDNMEEEQQPSP